MNPSVWSEGMYSSNSICLDGFHAEHLSSFQLDPVLSNVDVSADITQRQQGQQNAIGEYLLQKWGCWFKFDESIQRQHDWTFTHKKAPVSCIQFLWS
ncbi:Nine-heme cytochrome c [Dissostichus eleginoides]|uniref:Nine-heme cytochrome c n=1 Tax=Dissostichus eleginoides TaxID=100907 RepID=A0AAD9BVB9_DISEL|nr:Nine-heme cytochrome c [Dissostichus eleginoides]